MKSIIKQLEELRKELAFHKFQMEKRMDRWTVMGHMRYGELVGKIQAYEKAIAIVNAGTLSDDEIKMTELALNISHSMNHDKPPEDCKVCYGIINKMKLMRDEIIGGKEGLHEHE